VQRPFAAYVGDEPYVFVCYAHEDADTVYLEIQRLHEDGVRIWYDEGISPGTRWSDDVGQHVTGAALVLFFGTPQSVKSKHCLNEVNLAIDQGRPILVIQNGSFDFPIGLKLQLGAYQAILKHELSADQFADKLAAAVSRHMSVAPLKEPRDVSLPSTETATHWFSRRTIMLASILVAIVSTAAIAWQLHRTEYFWKNPLVDARSTQVTDFPGDEIDAAISPDGKLTAFLSDRDGQFDAWVGQIGTERFVNLTKGRLNDIAPVPIRRVSFNHDGSEVLITSGSGAGTNTLWRVPTLGGELRPFLRDAAEPIWSPSGEYLAYRTTEPGDPIFVADATGENPRQVFPGLSNRHCHYLLWSLDEQFIYFVGGSPTTRELDIYRIPVRFDGGTVDAEQITHHNSVVYLAWLDAKTLIYSAHADEGSGEWLYTIDVELRRPHRVSGGIAEQYLSVAVTPGAPRRMVVTLANPTVSLWSVPITGGVEPEDAVTALEVQNARAMSPRVTADGILFRSSSGAGDGLWKLQGATTREVWSSRDGGIVAPFAVSANGVVAVSHRTKGRTVLRLVNPDGAGARTIAESLDIRGAPAWSPDGKWLVVVAKEGTGTRLLKVPATGGAPVVLVDGPAHHPLWSPDGQFILYSVPLQGGSLALRKVAPDGTALPILEIQVPYVTDCPYRITPDSNAVVLLGTTGRRPNFVRVDLSTGERQPLTNLGSDASIESFDLTPDGKAIVFDRKGLNANIVAIDLRGS
jgi:Tol biopolymer transport system component